MQGPYGSQGQDPIDLVAGTLWIPLRGPQGPVAGDRSHLMVGTLWSTVWQPCGPSSADPLSSMGRRGRLWTLWKWPSGLYGALALWAL